MFKKILSFIVFCVASNFLVVGNQQSNRQTEHIQDLEKRINITFIMIKSAEFTKLIELVSPEGKSEFDSFINKAKSIIRDDLEFSNLIKTYNNLHNRFKNFYNREPIATLVLSIEGENANDFIPKDTPQFGEFTKILSEKELNELDAAEEEFKQFFFGKFESIFSELENSALNRELKEKTGDKIFSATAILS